MLKHASPYRKGGGEWHKYYNNRKAGTQKQYKLFGTNKRIGTEEKRYSSYFMSLNLLLPFPSVPVPVLKGLCFSFLPFLCLHVLGYSWALWQDTLLKNGSKGEVLNSHRWKSLEFIVDPVEYVWCSQSRWFLWLFLFYAEHQSDVVSVCLQSDLSWTVSCMVMSANLHDVCECIQHVLCTRSLHSINSAQREDTG